MTDLDTPNNTDALGVYFAYLFIFMVCLCVLVRYIMPLCVRVYCTCATHLYAYLNNNIRTTRKEY